MILKLISSNFQRHILFVILPFLWLFIFREIANYELPEYGLLFFHLFSSFYFSLYIAERFKFGYSGIKLVSSILSTIIWFCIINAIYYHMYYFLDKETFSNVPKTFKESIPEFLFFSIGNMFNNNLTEIKATNLFSKSIIHIQIVFSFAILVLILSFIRKEPENKKE